MKKPKKLKHPKRPSAKASNAVLKRYLERCKEVDKENKRRLAAWTKANKEREALKKRIASLKKY